MKLSERKEQVTFFEGEEKLSLLHLSDIHLWFSCNVLDDIKSSIEKNDPEIIVLTGDYYDTPTGARNFRKFLKEISQKYFVIFILGNHDRIYGRKISDLLFGIYNCVYVGDSVIRYQSKKGYFYNITSWKNKDLLPEKEDEVNLVLMHNPEKIRRDELSNIDLILAGHLHGGQFIFFRRKNGSNFPGSLLYKNCCDRKMIDNTTLIVSKGIGDTFPIRWNCPKEIVNITIV